MYHMPSRKVRILKRIAVILITWVVVLSGVILLTALTLGYGFNRKEGRVEQNGILQIGTKPSGARITINGSPFSSNTPAKLVSTPGEYELNVTRDGYQPWQKTVPIQAGGITWATYARLVPENLTPQPVADLPPTLAGGLPSGSGKRYAFLTDAHSPALQIAALDSDTVKISKAVLPAEFYEHSPEAREHSRFKLVLWSGNEQKVLLKHTYGAGKTTEWIIVDYENPKKSVNLTKLTGVSLNEVVFANSDGSRLYAMVNDAVRLIDVSDQTISRPLVEKVESFRVFGDGYIVFVTQPNEQHTQQVGYVRRDFKQPRVVEAVPYDGKNPVQFDIGKHYDTYYFLLSTGKKATLSSGKSLSEDATTPLKRKPVTAFELERPITTVNVTDNGQLAMAQDGRSFGTYNLETKRYYATDFKQADTDKPQKLRHLDTYLLWGMYKDSLRTYEFDGANQHDIMKLEATFDATFSPSGKYLYGVQKTEAGYQLARVQFLDLQNRPQG